MAAEPAADSQLSEAAEDGEEEPDKFLRSASVPAETRLAVAASTGSPGAPVRLELVSLRSS